MSDTKISITGEKPGIKSFEQFDVMGGKNEMSREEYKASTFHNATQADGDTSFKTKAELMEGAGETLLSESEAGETATEKKKEANLEP